MRATKFFVAALLLAGPLLAGCSSSSDFDPTDVMDKLDFLNVGKEDKLKGERKPLFPEGVPGVAQGIPQDLVKGHKPVETAVAPALEEPPQEKAKPKPRVVNRAPPKQQQKQKPTQVQVTPQPQQAQQQQQQAPAWPQAQQPQQAQKQQTGAQSPWPTQQPQQQTSPWPDAPAPNTFQR